jgi:hypothetical protein
MLLNSGYFLSISSFESNEVDIIFISLKSLYCKILPKAKVKEKFPSPKRRIFIPLK